MAAKLGILGESVVTDATTTTLYTVPANKSARVRVEWVVEGGGGAFIVSWVIGTPGDEFLIIKNSDSGDDTFSGVEAQATPDPADSLLAAHQGIQDSSGSLDISGGTGFDAWIAPLPSDYFLSTGDVVKVKLTTTAATDAYFRVVGVEDDA